MTIGAGNPPAFSIAANSLTDWEVKLPDIWPLPPQMGSLIRGAVMT